jgi:NAD(P)-dependent dehydrogenase (short-subunit alcohol dehydrogenase family)
MIRSAGMGYETASRLASHGAKVYLGSRSQARGEAAVEKYYASPLALKQKGIKKQGELIFFQLDLGTAKQTLDAAKRFLDIETRLDLLVNNAARLADVYELNEEGVERSIAAK